MKAGRRRDERGAVAIFVAAAMAMLMAVAAFTIDLGMQRVLARDLQAVADVAALDLSRQIPGKTRAQLEALAPGVLQRVLRANHEGIGDDVTAAQLFTSVRFGTAAAGADGRTVFTPSPTSGSFPTAVEVSASNSVSFGFARVFGADSGDAARTAVARTQGGACLQVGSFLTRLDSSTSPLLNPLLGGLLGTTLNLSAASYTGLANSSLTLAELVRVGGLNVGTADELLSLSNLSLRDFYLASARVLDAQGKRTEADVLRALAVGVATPTIKLGDLISAAPGDASALDTKLNVLSLVQGAAMLSRQGSAVSVPGLDVALGLANARVSLHVVEAAQIKCGVVGSTARTSQVRLDITVGLAAQSISVPELGTSVSLDAADVTLSFELGQALAQLTAVTCTAGKVDSLGVSLRSSVLGSLRVSANLRARAEFTVPLLGGSGILGSLLSTILSTLGLGSLLDPPRITVDNNLALTGGTTASTFTRTLTLPIPGSYTVPVGSGSGAVRGDVYLKPTVASTLSLQYRGLLTGRQTRVVVSTESLFTQVLNPLISRALSDAVNPLLSSVQTRLIGPLSTLLGVQYGGADVSAAPTATCAASTLVG